MLQKACYYLFDVKFLYLILFFGACIFYERIAKLLNKEFARVVLIAIPSIFLFTKIILNNPSFLSDDFAHLDLVSQNSFFQIFKMAMNPTGIWVGHRFFFGLWLFKIIYGFWGSNVVPYNVAIFMLNLGNVWLFYQLLGKRLTKLSSVIIAFVYGFFYLSWISNIHELLAGIFLLVNLNFFIKWLDTSNRKYFYIAVLFYTLSLFTKEIAFLSIFPMLGLYFIKHVKEKNKRKQKEIYILISIFIIYTAFYALGFLNYFHTSGGGYEMKISLPVIIHNLKFYFKQIFPVGGISLIIMAAIFVLQIGTKDYFGLTNYLSYFVFLLPVLFFVDHQAPYYNYLPLIFLLNSIGSLIDKFVKKNNVPNKKIVFTFIIILMFISLRIDKKLMDNCFLIMFPWR